MSAARAGNVAATEERNKRIAIGVFVVVMLGIGFYEYNQFADPGPAATPPAQVSVAPAATAGAKPAVAATASAGVPAKTVGSTAGALDPTLRMQAMLVTENVAYTGTGRNIFAGPGQIQEMAAIPKPLTNVRTNVAPPVPRPFVPQPTGPAPPPPIELKFFGMVTNPDGTNRRAFLLHADDVFLASKGDVVQRKYRIVEIGPNSIQVEDMSNNNRQTLPLQANP